MSYHNTYRQHCRQEHGITPLQYLLLLQVQGYPGRDWATVAELAERLQSHHHSVVGLIKRCEEQDLVKKTPGRQDGRQVEISLLPKGQELVAKLAALDRMRPEPSLFPAGSKGLARGLGFAWERQMWIPTIGVLVHYIGDIHQPLHVGSVFLDKDGKQVNPDEHGYDHSTNTVGGNALQCPCGNLHSLWDDVPFNYKRGRMNDALVKKARTYNVAKAPLNELPVLWANDAIRDARVLFTGSQFGKAAPASRGLNWSIALPLEYEKMMANMKDDALVRAGAHLTQILQDIWPE